MFTEEKALLALVYKDALQPSVQIIGNSLAAVFGYLSRPLLELQLKNEKTRLNMEKRLTEYSEKLNAIPEDKRDEVHPQIGVPIVEKLMYTTSDQIADMYTSLLASASNKDMMNTAHPAFISMIERMSADEAAILFYLKDKDSIQYCDINAYSNNNLGFKRIFEHVTMIEDDVDLIYRENVNAYLANFVSLGILFDKMGFLKTDKTEYNRIKNKYNVEKLERDLVPNVFKSIECSESYYQVTPFGKLFIQACIK